MLILLPAGCERKEIRPLEGHDFTVGDWILIYKNRGHSTAVTDNLTLLENKSEVRASPSHDPSCTTPQSWLSLYKDGSPVMSMPTCDHNNVTIGTLKNYLRPVEQHHVAFTNHELFLDELRRLRAQENAYVVAPKTTAKQYEGLFRITLMFYRDIDDTEASQLITDEFNRLYKGLDCRIEVFNSSISFSPVKKGYRVKIFCNEDVALSFHQAKILESDSFDHAHVGAFEHHSYQLTYFTY